MELFLVLAGTGLSGLLGLLKLASRDRAERIRSRALDHAFDARVARATADLRRERDQAVARLRQQDGERAAFEDRLSLMSHDLRTPLNAVVGFTALLSRAVERDDLGARHASAVQEIAAAAAEMARLIECGLPTGAAAPGPAGASGPTGADLALLTVLYVDDHPANRALMRQVMAALGPSLHVAEDGATGLALAQDLRPDLILLDINLPDMDGFTVKARLADDPLTAEIPVAAFTASAHPSDRRRGSDAGFCAWLTKPLDIPALARVLGETLAQPFARAA